MDPTIKKCNGPIIGYKAVQTDKNGKFFTDGLGNGEKVYWEIGSRKRLNNTEKLKLCTNGFHFFLEKNLCFAANYLTENNAILKIQAYGTIIYDTFKCCSSDIEILELVNVNLNGNGNSGNGNSGYGNSGYGNSGTRNSGNGNSGNGNSGNGNSGYGNSGNGNSGYGNSGYRNSGSGNSGDRNSGNRNSGNRNSGYENSGDRNSGDRNSGSRNSGYENSGYRNSGYRNSGYGNSGNGNSGYENSGSGNSGYRNSGYGNSGDRNSGDRNSGYGNSGNGNSGDFNSSNGYINFFCTQTKYFLFDIEVKKIPCALLNLDLSWFNLYNTTYKEAWKKCPESVLNTLRSIPEFSTEQAQKKFKEITGLDLFGKEK